MLSVNYTKTAVLIEQKTFPFAMPVVWQKPSTVFDLNSSLAGWLLHTGSLTERLQALTSQFGVELLGQRALAMDTSEQKLLPNNSQQKWQIREVLLQGAARSDDQAKNWVFARSVLPDELCRSEWSNLGNQPLGQRIFNDPSFVRSEFEIGKLLHHPITGEELSSSHSCWARRSKFTIGKHELIVAEAFLPDAPCYW